MESQVVADAIGARLALLLAHREELERGRGFEKNTRIDSQINELIELASDLAVISQLPVGVREHARVTDHLARMKRSTSARGL